MQRFFLNKENFHGETVRISDPETLHQMLRVMRMRTGDQFVALDGTSMEYVCTLDTLDAKNATATIVERRPNEAEPRLKITLYQAMPKKMELFEWVLQKGTEIGVSTFVPLVTARTARSEITKRERLEKILKEAAEQCERGKIPELAAPVSFTNALRAKNSSIKILLHWRGGDPPLSSKVSEVHSAGSCELFVGPEGGFSAEEISQAQRNSFLICSLGPRVLRTETAGIAASSLLLYS